MEPRASTVDFHGSSIYLDRVSFHNSFHEFPWKLVHFRGRSWVNFREVAAATSMGVCNETSFHVSELGFRGVSWKSLGIQLPWQSVVQYAFPRSLITSMEAMINSQNFHGSTSSRNFDLRNLKFGNFRGSRKTCITLHYSTYREASMEISIELLRKLGFDSPTSTEVLPRKFDLRKFGN